MVAASHRSDARWRVRLEITCMTLAEEAKRVGPGDGLYARVDVELSIELAGVRPDGVDRDEQRRADLARRQIRREKTQHLEFSFGRLLAEPAGPRPSFGCGEFVLDGPGERGEPPGVGEAV